MPTFRETIGDAFRGWIDKRLLGERRTIVRTDALERLQDILVEAYQYGPASMSPEQLVAQLREQGYDSLWAIETMLTNLYGYLPSGEGDRTRAVDRSRLAYHYDINTRHAVRTWTNFGFGQRVQVKPKDPKAVETWDEFWTATRNREVLKQRNLHEESNKLLRDGERFYVFFGSRLERAEVSIRVLDTKTITRIVREEEDNGTSPPLFYVRTLTSDLKLNLPGVEANALRGVRELWYPDWQADEKVLDAVEIPTSARRMDKVIDGESGTDVVMCHAAINRGDDGRGWPQFTQALDWTKALKQLLQDYATVARANAAFVREIVTKGGSRGVAAMRNVLQTQLSSSEYTFDANPPPVPGSSLIHNKAVDTKEIPLNRGAGDAQITTTSVVSQVSTATEIPPHFFGWPQVAQNRATARESSRPFQETMERYQEFWADVLGDWVAIVLMLEEGAGRQAFADKSADVSLESPLMIELDEVARVMTANSNAVVAMAMDPAMAERANERLAELALTALGVRDAGEVLRPPEEEEAEEEAVSLMESREVGLVESHLPQVVDHVCPFCGWPKAEFYEGHKGLLRCAKCKRTFDPQME